MKSKKVFYFREEYKDRIESQDELDGFLEKSFQGVTSMDYKSFVQTVEKVSSDFYLFVIFIII